MFLWLFITYGRDYQHSISYSVTFTDSNNRAEYHTSDSVITVGVKTNGFEYLVKGRTRHKKHIVVDIDKLNINLSKGKVTIPTSRLKPQIMQILGIRGTDISLSPSNIELTWNKLYSKRIKIVNKCTFKFEKPYDAYYPADILIDEAIIEGNEKDIAKIQSVSTQQLVYNNINKTSVFLVPLDLSQLPDGVTCRLKNVPIKITAEKYTENVVSLPVKVVRYEDYRNIKVLPKEVKLRYRIAVKDYAKVNDKNFNAFVLCSDQAMSKSKKLKVNITNVPEYVRITDIYPQKVEYILFK
ncbi:MAG: hypothetical protein J6P44_03445 [Bacteroidales bacterium]|nr:hypothetical protein [Bacteroidales bacterium]